MKYLIGRICKDLHRIYPAFNSIQFNSIHACFVRFTIQLRTCESEPDLIKYLDGSFIQSMNIRSSCKIKSYKLILVEIYRLNKSRTQVHSVCKGIYMHAANKELFFSFLELYYTNQTTYSVTDMINFIFLFHMSEILFVRSD